MKKITMYITLLALGAFLAGSAHASTNTATKFIKNKFTHVLKAEQKDILENPLKEKIILYVQENKEGMPLYWSLVVNGFEKVRLDNQNGFYSRADFKIVDIGTDKKPEILIYRYNTGSGGGLGLNVFRPSTGNYREIYSVKNVVDDSRFSVKYLGRYKVAFSDKLTGLQTTILLNKDNYKGIEDMLKNIATWVDPVMDYELIDRDADKIKEIITNQRVIGVSHADTIANLKTTYKLINNKYQPVSIAIYDAKDVLLKRVKISSAIAAPRMDEKEAVKLITVAMSKYWYVVSGGKGTGGPVATFNYNNKEYRYFGKDLDTKTKFYYYLQNVFTIEASNTLLKKMGVIEYNGKMAQPNADGGSLLQWQNAQASLIKGTDTVKEYEMKVPYGEGKNVEFEPASVKVKLVNGKWLVDKVSKSLIDGK